MERGYHSAEQIVREIEEADGRVGEGGSLVEVCEHLEAVEQAYWR